MLLMYEFAAIEQKWQRRWERERLYRAPDESGKPKYYSMEMLPYPSGDLHVGHAKNYTLGDAVARMMRMLGYNVLHPMGWDAFGLPAENAAIERGIDPAAWTAENILNMRRQIRLDGHRLRLVARDRDLRARVLPLESVALLAALPSAGSPTSARRRSTGARTIKPCSPTSRSSTDAAGAARISSSGATSRSGFCASRRTPTGCLADLDKLGGWPERTRTMQRNWIGRSEGANVDVRGRGSRRRRYRSSRRASTRSTASRFSPSPPSIAIVDSLKTHRFGRERRAQIDAFAASLKSKSELERTSLMEKARHLHRRIRDPSALARTRADLADELRARRIRRRRGDGRSGARRARLRFRKAQRAARSRRSSFRTTRRSSCRSTRRTSRTAG